MATKSFHWINFEKSCFLLIILSKNNNGCQRPQLTHIRHPVHLKVDDFERMNTGVVFHTKQVINLSVLRKQNSVTRMYCITHSNATTVKIYFVYRIRKDHSCPIYPLSGRTHTYTMVLWCYGVWVCCRCWQRWQVAMLAIRIALGWERPTWTITVIRPCAPVPAIPAIVSIDMLVTDRACGRAGRTHREYFIGGVLLVIQCTFSTGRNTWGIQNSSLNTRYLTRDTIVTGRVFFYGYG